MTVGKEQVTEDVEELFDFKMRKPLVIAKSIMLIFFVAAIVIFCFGVKEIIDVDGLKFKDLNANGQLDVYEDWRNDSATRTKDLLSQMNLDEKIGALFHVNDGGAFSSLYPYTEEYLWSNESTYTVGSTTYVPLYHSIISDNVTTYLRNENGTPEAIAFKSNSMQKIAETYGVQAALVEQ